MHPISLIGRAFFVCLLACPWHALGEILFHSDFEVGQTYTAARLKPGTRTIRLIENHRLSQWAASGGIGMIHVMGDSPPDDFRYSERKGNELVGVEGIEHLHPARSHVFVAGLSEWKDANPAGLRAISFVPSTNGFRARFDCGLAETARLSGKIPYPVRELHIRFLLRLSADLAAMDRIQFSLMDVFLDSGWLLPKLRLEKKGQLLPLGLKLDYGSPLLRKDPALTNPDLRGNEDYVVEYSVQNLDSAARVSLRVNDQETASQSHARRNSAAQHHNAFFLGKHKGPEVGFFEVDDFILSDSPLPDTIPRSELDRIERLSLADSVSASPGLRKDRFYLIVGVVNALILLIFGGLVWKHRSIASGQIAQEGEETSDVPLLSHDSPHDEQIKKAQDFILENYSRPISTRDVAQHLNVTGDWMMRLFSRGTGKTVNAYINEVRLAHAKRLLTDTTFTITEIAFRTGFRSLNHFEKTFSRTEKASPKKYRETSRNPRR